MPHNPLHLEQDEHVIFEVRRHWIVFFGYSFGLFMSAIFPFIIFAVLKIFVPFIFNIWLPGNVYALFVFLYALWLMSIWISFFLNWTKYYLDVWYVTEKRIVAIDQRSIFNREISNLRFDKIQDVTVDVHGFLATMLDFGSVRVQTASEDSREFFMATVRHPEEVRRIIFNQHNKIADF